MCTSVIDWVKDDILDIEPEKPKPKPKPVAAPKPAAPKPMAAKRVKAATPEAKKAEAGGGREDGSLQAKAARAAAKDTLLTGALGLGGEARTRKKTLLGQ